MQTSDCGSKRRAVSVTRPARVASGRSGAGRVRCAVIQLSWQRGRGGRGNDEFCTANDDDDDDDDEARIDRFFDIDAGRRQRQISM